MTDWSYAFAIDAARSAALLARQEWPDIQQRIVSEASYLCCHYQSCDENTAFGRVAYCVRVSNSTFDLFYNSPYGYRGAYFRSPYEGLRVNAQLIEALTPKLIAGVESSAIAEERQFILESLRSPSSKAWLAENGLHQCALCEGEWGNPTDDAPEILNGRWEMEPSNAALRGRKAPRLTKIRVFGAFIDDRHNELVPARKRFRALDIHKWGWS